MKSIECDLHDYFEIACTFNYELEVILLDGGSFVGIARDLGYDQQKNETLFLEGEKQSYEIALIKIRTIESLTLPSHFKKVQIN